MGIIDGTRKVAPLGNDFDAALKAWRELYKVDRRNDQGRMHYLYRHYDPAGRLLYVGISLSAITRHLAHRTRAAWYDDIANITIERFPSREEAAAAEIEAILIECPIHNIRHRGRPKKKKLEYKSEPPPNGERWFYWNKDARVAPAMNSEAETAAGSTSDVSAGS